MSSIIPTIREAFTRSPIQYKEYLSEFWYSANALGNSKVSFLIPTGGIYGVLEVNTFRKAIRTHYLFDSSDYVDPPSIDIVRPWFSTIRYEEEVSAKGILKKSLLPPRKESLNDDDGDMLMFISSLGSRYIAKKVKFRVWKGAFNLVSELRSNGRRKAWNDDDGDMLMFISSLGSRYIAKKALKPNQLKGPPFTDYMMAICNAEKPVAYKVPKPSSKGERLPQGTKPRAKPGHKKHSTSNWVWGRSVCQRHSQEESTSPRWRLLMAKII
ncbi:hypothetical protein Tco_1430042 [Tanacetum coccineum]